MKSVQTSHQLSVIFSALVSIGKQIDGIWYVLIFFWIEYWVIFFSFLAYNILKILSDLCALLIIRIGGIILIYNFQFTFAHDQTIRERF